MKNGKKALNIEDSRSLYGWMNKAKRLWSNKYPEAFPFYCPLCKSERKIPYPPRPTRLKGILQVLSATVFFVLVFFPIFSWKGFVVFVPFWSLYEIFFRARLRVKLYCQSCGFDPFLFMIDHKKAKTEVQEFWKKKFQEKGIELPDANVPGTKELRRKAFQSQLDLTKKRAQSMKNQ